MSSPMDPPSIHPSFAPYPPSPSPSIRSYTTAPPPRMNFQTRSYSTPSISLSSRLSCSSLHSQYSSSSDRSLSCSPGPSTPRDLMSRSPSFSHERLHKSTPQRLPMSIPFSSVLPQPKGFFSHSSQYQDNQSIHPFQQPVHTSASIPHPATASRQQQYHGQTMPSPRDLFPSFSSASRDQVEHHHRESPYHARGDRSPYNGPGDYFSRPTTTSSYHHHLPTPTTPTSMDSISSRLHSNSPMPLTPLQASTRSVHSTAYTNPPSAGARMVMMDEDCSRPMSRSPSLASDHSHFSPELSPFSSEGYYMGPSHGGLATPALTPRASMSSLSSSLSRNNLSSASLASSTTSSSSTDPQLLMCPVCSRTFKPSKNQNCNLRRHLKNVHNMSPTIHPRKCKWDSLPDGRVKDDKDRKERTRKSKRLWARKFRLRRKVEEAAVVLSMLSQTM